LKDIGNHREVLTDILWRALEGIAPKLPEADRELIADFVDNGEFGVAAQWIEAIVQAEKLDMPPQSARALTEARKLLKAES
jgi:hypothetical protein